jgi:hypothetical protein
MLLVYFLPCRFTTAYHYQFLGSLLLVTMIAYPTERIRDMPQKISIMRIAEQADTQNSQNRINSRHDV